MEKIEMIYWTTCQYEQWDMIVAATTKGLCYIGTPNASFDEFTKWQEKRLPTHALQENISIVKPYCRYITAYLEGDPSVQIPALDLQGTLFQKEVWNALSSLDYGQIVSYSAIAERLGKPKSVRAVARAIGANPVLIFIPCHRIIAKSGQLGGFRAGLEMKKKLIALEEETKSAMKL